MLPDHLSVKYVALLAFNKIVITHPYLVAEQEDVILECIDSSDITIRIQALDLVQGMVTSDSLVSVVSRLMKQLKMTAPARDARGSSNPPTPEDSDGEELVPALRKADPMAALPEDYCVDVIGRILIMCSKDNYSNVADFDWYIDVLTQLVRMAPVSRAIDGALHSGLKSISDVSEKIGDELRNVAVKVRAMRVTVVRASDIILAQLNSDTPAGHSISSRALKSVCWILGEYAVQLSQPEDSLSGLLQLLPRSSVPEVTTTTLQSIAKIFSSIAGNELEPWSAERKTKVCLLMARIVHVFEPLALHPNLEVQGRAVEFIELLKLTAEAASAQAASTDESHEDAPLLLTQAIPSLFNGWELNSVAPKAQLNVPVPEGIDLDEHIHADLDYLLSQANSLALEADDGDDFETYYHMRPPPTSISSASAPAISRLAEQTEEATGSYQDPTEDSYLDADIIARRKAERQERNKDDPFYIPSNKSIPRTSTPIHNILQDNNGPDLDIDSIPIMQLDLSQMVTSAPTHRPKPQPRQKVVIAADETLEGSETPNRTYDLENNSDSFTKTKAKKLKQSLLGVNSSTLGSFSLEGEPKDGFDYEHQQLEELEMQQAMREVERLRLEMQRANERIQVAQGVDAEGAAVVRKKKKKKKKQVEKIEEGSEVKPKKKAKPADEGGTPADDGDVVLLKPKKKKKSTTKMADMADVT